MSGLTDEYCGPGCPGLPAALPREGLRPPGGEGGNFPPAGGGLYLLAALVRGFGLELGLAKLADFTNFWRARSRLYQNETLQENNQNMRLTTFFKLY